MKEETGTRGSGIGEERTRGGTKAMFKRPGSCSPDDVPLKKIKPKVNNEIVKLSESLCAPWKKRSDDKHMVDVRA